MDTVTDIIREKMMGLLEAQRDTTPCGSYYLGDTPLMFGEICGGCLWPKKDHGKDE